MRDMHATGPSRWRSFLQNAALVLGSLLVLFAFCELFLFRVVLLPPDVPQRVTVDGVLRYVPGQTGVHRVQNDIAAPFAINAQGWNSSHKSYALERTSGVPRIAVIGDSMVESFQVSPEQNFADRLERKFADGGRDVEVYRFALSGTPLSHYLLVLESEVVKYAPDLVIVLLIHNDFHESFFRGAADPAASPFQRLLLQGGRVVREVPPPPYAARWMDSVRQLATWRYLRYREQLSIPFIMAQLRTGRNREQMIANVYADEIREHIDEIRVATDYLFGRIGAVTRQNGINLLFVMDGHRAAIYDDEVAKQEDALALNAVAAEFAAKHRIPFVDLHPRFAAEWRMRRQKFEFPSDGHWNASAHEFVAGVIYDYLNGHPLMEPLEVSATEVGK